MEFQRSFVLVLWGSIQDYLLAHLGYVTWKCPLLIVIVEEKDKVSSTTDAKQRLTYTIKDYMDFGLVKLVVDAQLREDHIEVVVQMREDFIEVISKL